MELGILKRKDTAWLTVEPWSEQPAEWQSEDSEVFPARVLVIAHPGIGPVFDGVTVFLGQKSCLPAPLDVLHSSLRALLGPEAVLDLAFPVGFKSFYEEESRTIGEGS